MERIRAAVYAVSSRGISYIGVKFGVEEEPVTDALPSMNGSEKEILLFVPSTIELSADVSILYRLEAEAKRQ